MVNISTILGRIDLVSGENILGEFKAGLSLSTVNYTIVTSKRVVVAKTNRIGTEMSYRSIPLRSILSVDLQIDKRIMGDVYLNTLSGQVECHVYDRKSAESMYNLLMNQLI